MTKQYLQCYNEENQIKGDIYIMAYVIGDNCVSCGTCADTCPVNAISEGADRYVIDPDQFVSCGSCASVCPCEAISEE